ncbi:Excinuclease ABC subunit A [Actinomyces bovis]|uniref:UvrABC system protein A n=1 Tax=Actinomyces bovis TaxID=1658 RepID=A0ABY1VQD3_9ACTO|nr:excinuclease ABC subunit UvrA [Actinomyces bovis]SPT54008.1 Excinuclease ABC subunit A [Actinomyces bovis]VEG53866.1 Excinuclease ABC subunit A [Actinomyces israelii]
MTKTSQPAQISTADSHDYIRVTGARENNLRGCDVVIPKRRLTVFTGVSGSGKSSLVFSTIAAESRRLINETYPSFVQGFMPSTAHPDVDSLEGLTPAIIVDQERLGANPRSTLGTASDLNSALRILFSRLSTPQIGGPQAFAFNIPSVTGGGAIKTVKAGRTVTQHKHFSIQGGMCPRCEGTGRVTDIDLAAVYDEKLSLLEGAIKVPGYTPDGWLVRVFAESGFLPASKPIRSFTKKELEDFLHKEPTKVKIDTHQMTYEGLLPKLRKSILSKDPEALQPHLRAFVDRAVVFQSCPECEGTRLAESARQSTIAGISIAQACAMQLSDLATWVSGLEAAAKAETKAPTDAQAVQGITGVAPLLTRLRESLNAFVSIGLGYLSLDRPASTLSGGEAQRMKLVRHLGSALTDVTYVFDEPSIGLHPHDIAAMNELLISLRDKGNTVLVVEHKPEVIAIADHVIDLGPGAGSAGGQVVFTGSVDELRAADTLTGKHLAFRASLKSSPRSPTGFIEIRGASTNNLRQVDVDLPRGVLTVVTGVAGSGKSSLIHGHLSPQDGVVTIDQSPIKGSRRSNPATYTGLLEHIRKAFAKANSVKPALFSANSEGACPVCNGAGVIDTELGFMETVTTTCQACEGRRYNDEVLIYTFGGKSIAEVLALSASEALELFSAKESRVPAATKILRSLCDVGLGYLRLGQALNTLSGGERQRLKLAVYLREAGEVLVLDEPTVGLHLADIQAMLELLDHLVDTGRTVVVIEHHQAVMANADWIIDLGPGAGHDGGQVVFTGTPAELVHSRETLTGEYLARYL